MQFYLVSPLLAFLVFKVCRTARGAAPFLVLLLGLSVFWRWRFCVVPHLETEYWIEHVFFPLWANLEFFLAGFLATPLIEFFRPRLAHRGGFRHPWLIRTAVYLFFLGFITLAAFIIRQWGLGSPWGYFSYMALLPALAIFAVVVSIVFLELCAHSQPPRAKSLPEQLDLIRKSPVRAFELFGTLTYGIYIWHMPILMKISPYLTEIDPLFHFAELFGVVVVVTVLVSGITYHFIEYPFDAKKKFQQPVNRDPAQGGNDETPPLVLG
jgi:peptidoglycan/LPS O-acetylase OafA/YrhL